MSYVCRSFALLVFLAAPGRAQDFKMEPGPKSPAESLKCIKARPGFKVELMVSEPLVMDPIAFAWGPDGKFWVVEMGDYPLGIPGPGGRPLTPNPSPPEGRGEKGGKSGGKIKYFEKTKPDGPYDKMTVFMDGLGYPTGVFPYGKGVLVTCAPEIFYAEMGKDGKIQKECLFIGFKEGNQQHCVNGLSWGIDNWIYGANGDSGGTIEGGKLTGLLKREIMQGSVDIRGRDFRFKVDTGEFEAVSGQSQFGRCRDDWGNWFGNNNSNPMFHFGLEDRYLKRNPHVLYPDPKVQVIPGAVKVFPISKPLPRFNTPTALNHFTSACSTIIYRDNLFGPEFEGNAFISEPVHNLIHREIIKPKGLTFSAERAKDEQESEFLASSDNWFRPAMIQVGPDGALWIADMYRYVIEHPEWIPKDWQKKLDLRAGHDKGRIYRVYPEGKTPRAIPRLDKMPFKDLVKQLDSPSGWVRDTAHQLIIPSFLSDKDRPTARQALQKMFEDSKVPQARLHALHAYQEVSVFPNEWVPRMLGDAHPMIRKNALRILEGEAVLRTSPKLVDTLVKDPEFQVRQQLAYSLLENVRAQNLKEEDYALLTRFVSLVCEHAEFPHILAAGMSSITDRYWPHVIPEFLKHEKIPSQLLGPMMRMAKAYGEPLDSARLFVRALNMQAMPAHQRMAHVVEMLQVMEKNDLPLQKLLESSGDKDTKNTIAQLKKIQGEAVAVVQDPKAPWSDRLVAMRLLGQGLGNDRDDHKLLLTFLTPQMPDDVQAAVINQLSRNFDPRVPGLLLSPWKNYSPALRGQVLDTLLSRPIWTRMTLETIKRKDLPANEIDAIRRQRLMLHKDTEIRALAKEVFAASSSPDRGKVVADYWLRMPSKGDAAKGAKLFAKSCAVCHKLGDVGQNVGPDFASIGDKSVQGLLNAILDPNRALESRYISYAVTTKKGLVLTGILTSETSTSVTLLAAYGKPHQVLRTEIDELYSTGKSLMPEGFDKDLSPKDLADVIEHIRTNLPAPARRTFPGNEPKTNLPGKDGRLHLLPVTAAIYGPSIVIEKQYGNLGYWSKAEDHVIWTVELQKETAFSVWLDYAVAPDSAGNTLAIQCSGEKLTHKVKSTGSWDAYQLQSIGALRIPAGKHEIVVRGEGPIRGALIDLKGIELRPR